MNLSVEVKLAFQRIRRELAVVKDAANAAIIYVDDVVSRLDKETEQSPRVFGRAWTITLDAFVIEPGKYATRSTKIAVPQFSAQELLLAACDGTLDGVRLHQITVDDFVHPRIVGRRTRPKGVAAMSVKLDSTNAPCFREIGVTLHNTGKETRKVDIVVKGVAKL